MATYKSNKKKKKKKYTKNVRKLLRKPNPKQIIIGLKQPRMFVKVSKMPKRERLTNTHILQ